MCLSLTFLTMPVFGQLQIESSGKTKTTSEYRKEANYIQWNEDGYYFKIWDYTCSKYNLAGDANCVMLYLGQNQEEIRQSATTLQNWFSKASNDDFIFVTNKNGQRVCVYKFNANIYFSYGNELNCKAIRVQFGADMTAAIDGGAYKTKAQRDELLANIEFGKHVLTGMCSFKKEFLKSIKNFKEDEHASHNIATPTQEDNESVSSGETLIENELI